MTTICWAAAGTSDFAVSGKTGAAAFLTGADSKVCG